MRDTVIVVENLSKSYLLGHQMERRDRYTLRDVLVRGAQNFARKTADLMRGRQVIQGDAVEEFWALKDVSFEVKQGEVLGIIGRNGAGKSTLLKVLSRITEPTEGRIQLRGRVASLLEVGTGFHSELTGRENIFLNGAILGMTRREIRSKFDEIVAFAEVDRFLDTPVKRYSSGMYVRLAFAVAAHLEPEILIVDEVLAVGDAEFQKKCLGKMHDVSLREGRTILFVSHNLAAITELATRAILLSAGKLQVNDAPNVAISTYLSARTTSPIYEREFSATPSKPHIRRAEVLTSDPNGTHRFGEPITIRFQLSHRMPLARGCFSFQVINQYNQAVIHAYAYYPSFRIGSSGTDTTLICHFPSLQLNVGQFRIRWYLSEPPGAEVYETVDEACPFEIVRTDSSVLWGWRPEACVYHEHWTWSIEQAAALEEVSNGTG